MIGAVLRIGLLRLWNNKQELLLVFVVPVIFFSIFAVIFTRGVGKGATAVQLAVIDLDASPPTAALRQRLANGSAVVLKRWLERPSGKREGSARDAEPDMLAPAAVDAAARNLIQRDRVALVLVIPRGFQHALEGPAGLPLEMPLELLTEGSDPVAPQVVKAVIAQELAGLAGQWRQAAGQAADHPARPGRAIPAQRAVLTRPPVTPRESPPPAAPTTGAAESFTSGTAHVASAAELRSSELHRPALAIAVPSVRSVYDSEKTNPQVAMYAAGIAVMFLLFSASGAGGSLLEEYEAGTLERLLSTDLTLTQLLAGKWLYITLMGVVQLCVMFLWGQLVFGVDLWNHLPGFLVMTLCTAAATASLAICLAVLCRSRAQLNGVSIVLILVMSAAGGSMIPRYIMSEEMQRIGQLTFNAWALDGFQKVFWYDLPVWELRREVGVLLAATAYLGVTAWLFSDRWQAR